MPPCAGYLFHSILSHRTHKNKNKDNKNQEKPHMEFQLGRCSSFGVDVTIYISHILVVKAHTVKASSPPSNYLHVVDL